MRGSFLFCSALEAFSGSLYPHLVLERIVVVNHADSNDRGMSGKGIVKVEHGVINCPSTRQADFQLLVR